MIDEAIEYARELGRRADEAEAYGIICLLLGQRLTAQALLDTAKIYNDSAIVILQNATIKLLEEAA